MNRLLIQIFFGIFLLPTAYGQVNQAEWLNISKFIPKGYSELKFTKGNLNLDSIDDVILVLKKNGEETISTTEKPVKRNLLILIGQADKSYKLFFQNENVVCYYGFDPNFIDAFVDVRVEKGHFSIDHYGGFAHRWGRSTTFEYNPSVNNWFLSEDEYSTMDATDSEEPNKTISEKTLTNKNFGEIPFDKFNIYIDLPDEHELEAYFSKCQLKKIEESNESFDRTKLIEQSDLLSGLWISEDYLVNIEKTQSIYKNREYKTKFYGFHLDKKNLQTDSAYLFGFTDHEGGYGGPLKYDSEINKFTNDIDRLKEFPSFPEPFDLNITEKNVLEMYFPKNKVTDRYKKVETNLDTELRQLLIAGGYIDTKNNSKIQFNKDGKVKNFNNYVYYELVFDFGEGIEYDAIVFFKSPEGGNWSYGEIYKFDITADTLKLQFVDTDWDRFEHKITNDIHILKKE